MIHSYRYNVNSTRWDILLFLGTSPNQQILLHSVMTEPLAAAWASYLNGGNYTPFIVDEIL